MSDKEILIPKHGGAGVAFAGVEFKDCFILVGSVLIGLLAGFLLGLGLKGYIGIPVAGYFLNTFYLDWKEDRPPGYLRAMLYRAGVLGYSKVYPRANMIYIGDSVATNPGWGGVAVRSARVVEPDEEG